MTNRDFDSYKEELDKYILGLSYDDVPNILKDSMEYTLNLPGKRVRGVLLLAAYSLLNKNFYEAMPYATAIEMIHSYSLIHDDLPAMDNDTLRRGMPCNHIKYGEGIAILAGDGLLNYSYEIMLNECVKNNFDKRYILAAQCISKHAGITGMIAGQIKDITSNSKNGNASVLQYIHEHKTSDMIIASVLAGLYLSGASDKQIEYGKNYAYHLGMAFQIVDDVLDAIGDANILGKSIGKDKADDKLSWVNLFGIEKSKQDAIKHTEMACDSMKQGFDNSDFFVNIANLLQHRVK